LAINISNPAVSYICNPTEYLSQLQEQLTQQLDSFIKYLKNADLFENPIIIATLNKLIGSVSTFTVDQIMEQLEKEFGGFGSLVDIFEDLTSMVAALLTFDAQIKLAMYALLLSSLEEYLKERIETLTELNKLFTEVDAFLRNWDTVEIASNEYGKLKNAELQIRKALANLSRAEKILAEQNKNASVPYKQATGNVNNASKQLETRPEISNSNELAKYWKDWWETKQQEFIAFAENSLKIMNAVPADRAILNKLMTNWDSIYILTSKAIAEEVISGGKSPFNQQWLTSTAGNIFGANKLIPANESVRNMVGEISNLDATWEGMVDYAKSNESFIEKWRKEVEDLHGDMVSSLEEKPNEILLAAKNATFLLQTRAIGLGMSTTDATVREYDNLTKDFDQLQKIIIMCQEYPEEGDHVAETLPDLILESYQKIFAGFASKGGTREARVHIGNIKRQITSAITYDTKFYNELKNYNVLDNSLVQTALLLYNQIMGQVNSVLTLINKNNIAQALNALKFAEAGLGLVSTAIKNISNFDLSVLNICGKDAIEGEAAETRSEATMALNSFQYQKIRQNIEAAKNQALFDPHLAASMTEGIDYRGGGIA
jgi:hypothetical protein